MSPDDDRQVVEIQIGRPLRAESEVVARCHLGLPVVLKVPPHLDDGTPFPTLYWLTCPLAVTRIGRLEAGGGVRRMEAKSVSDPDFGAALDRAHHAYAEERDAMITDPDAPRPSGGVGGTARGVKCLHACMPTTPIMPQAATTRWGAWLPVGSSPSIARSGVWWAGP
jgi:hypothetical protein